MTERERILCVYRGSRPDRVPVMLDLSHWFYQRTQRPWDLSAAYAEPEWDLIGVHRRHGVGFYMPNLAAFYGTYYPDTVRVRTTKMRTLEGLEIVSRFETPTGSIERRRRWEPRTYAWGISRWGIRTPRDLVVFGEALGERRFEPHWDRYRAWADAVGDLGVVYLPLGYSAVGHLLHYWMGVEGFIYGLADEPALMRRVVERVNANTLTLVDLAAQSPAAVVIMGDNISSDVQPPHLFEEWSGAFYREAIRRLHAGGKKVAVHIDGKLRGALHMVRGCGADAADAVTPTPMGDLTPAQCRGEAGPDLLLSGGVSADLWLPHVPVERFDRAVFDWLDLRHSSPALIANAGDQVPPGAEESRIARLLELTEKHGAW
ncbi:MAG: hypothetical protein JXR77_15250 [Lentisphaeria bacterium]|nr:hypothetical protein [Lentisphaeria bacterium]